MKRVFLFVVIALAVLIFRFWMINNIGFTNIEHTLVYRSWSLSRFGLDEYGRKLPLLFGSAEGIQLPAVSYLSTPLTFVFGSNIMSEQILDFFFFLLPFFGSFLFGYGIGFATLLTLNPIFFWPGTWEAKLVTVCLLALWKILNHKKSNIILIISISILSLATSFDAWFVIPLILLIGLFIKVKNGDQKKVGLAVLTILIVFALVVITKLDNNIANQLKSKYFNLNQDVSILNSINNFRGEDLKMGFNISGRLLHNKLQYIPVIMGQSLSYLSPSFLFATGDKNSMSNSMWVPPLLSIYFLLILFSMFSPQDKENKFLYIWILAGVLLLGMMKFPQTEQKIYLIAIPLTLIIANQMKNLPGGIIFFIYPIAFLNLFFLGTISGTVNSIYKESCSIDMTQSILKTVNSGAYTKISIADDICSDLGPGLAMLRSKKPSGVEGEFIQKNIRSIENIKIISPKEINLIDLSKTNVYILSKKQTDAIPDYLPKNRLVNKQLIYAGSNDDYSMYILSADVKK